MFFSDYMLDIPDPTMCPFVGTKLMYELFGNPVPYENVPQYIWFS
jgi:hypothetical protein